MLNKIKIVFLIFFLFSCNTEKKSEKESFKSNLSISEILNTDYIRFNKLNPMSSEMLKDWSPLISVISKINKIKPESINHKAFINSINIDLEEINKNNIPFPFSIPEVIGRIRVFKTYIYKMNSYDLDFSNLEIYADDFMNMIQAYNALIDKINLIVTERNN